MLEFGLRAWLGTFPNSSGVYFWGFLIWICLLFLGIYAIYGKRLKDFGRSVWPVTGLVTFWLVAIIAFGILYGAGDYMSEFSQYERKAVIDDEVKAKLRADYEARLSSAPQWLLSLVLWASSLIFTAWVGLTRGDEGPNRYGPPPGGVFGPPK